MGSRLGVMKYVRFELLHRGKITVTDNGDERVCINYHGHAMKMKATASPSPLCWTWWVGES